MELQVNRSGVKKSFIGSVGNLTWRTIACSGYWFSKIVPSGGLQGIGGFAVKRFSGVVMGSGGGEAEGVCNKSYKFRAKMRLFLNFF